MTTPLSPPESTLGLPPVHPSLRGCRILIVEDEFIIANDLRFIVEQLGHEVVGLAKSVRLARQLLDQQPVDLVLVDIHLQDTETGIDLAHSLKDHYRLPFLFVTSHADPRTVQAAQATLPDGYVVKPFQEKDIRTAIDIAYYRHAHSQENQLRQQKETLIAAIDALIRADTWPERLLALGRLFQPMLPFNLLYTYLEQPTDTPLDHGFCRIGVADYQVIDPEGLLRMTRLTPGSVRSLRQQLAAEAPACLPGPAHAQLARRHPLAGTLFGTFGVQASLLLRLELAPAGALVLVFGHKQPDTYQPRHLAWLEAVVEPLRPTFEKLLAADEIRALTKKLETENTYLQEELQTHYNFADIVGTSEPLREVFRRIDLVAPTDATVLLEGETGTGKELFARAIHHASARREQVIVKVNCAALPANLIESELFGHEKGAFTGAVEKRIGKFELAHGGTLFLDEIGELPLELQPKLLRVLQEKEIERIGGRQTIRCDVRIVAATNRRLDIEVAEGRFRQDLYYRLNVFAISLPPLRQRPGDVALLAQHFLQKFAKRFGRPARHFSANAIADMQAYDWPGNIRELEHVVEQSLILSQSPLVELSKPLNRSPRPDTTPPQPVVKTWQQAERDNIMAALDLANGRIRGTGGAAELLNIHPSTLDSRMKTLGIRRGFA